MKCIGCYLNELWQKMIGTFSNPDQVLQTAKVSQFSKEEQATVNSPKTSSPQIEESENEGSCLPDDDPLNNTAWVKLAEACVELFAELDHYQVDFDPPRREIAEHVCGRLTEILSRNGVGLIDEDGAFDRNLHAPNPSSDDGPKPENASVRVICPGFYIGRRVLRRARVETFQKASTIGE